ncbi:MAG: hypothetical protein IJE19_06485 [Clostridia bacterium]|nr:hypothetical protein [Clostridia bacterium]
MKKIFSAFVVAVMAAVPMLFCSSSQSCVLPEIMTVEAIESGNYGCVDYSCIDSNGNELELFNRSYVPERKTPSVSLFSSSYSAMSELPSSYDSRTKNCITSAKQQGASGNCWAFSAMSMLESDAILKGFDDIESADYSEAHFSWFTSRSLTDNADDLAYGDGYLNDTPFMTGGNWIIAAGSLARWTGAAEDADYPFNFRDLTAMGNYDESCRYDTGSGTVIESAQEFLDISDAKNWIMDHGSATFAFYFDDAYYNSNSFSYYYDGTETLNHEITVIGWNDNYSRYNFNESCRPASDGAWLCKNSWGLNWADDGFFWISYYDPSIEQFAGISARDADELYRNYTYNGTGWESYISHGGNAKISNVFTSKGDELLTSASAYTMLPEQEIKVYVYKNLVNNFTNPEQGELASEYSTILDRPGYHTINFVDEIPLEQGTVFSIVVEYLTDGTLYIPVEVDGQGTNSYSANAKESYVYLPYYNAGWYDALRYGFKNVFVQAFTKCDHMISHEITDATCTSDGIEKSMCSVCGKLVSEAVIPASGHDFSEWSNYVHDFETDTEIRSRECINCGLLETDSIVYAKNTIKLEDFIQMIFDRIFEMLKQIFR